MLQRGKLLFPSFSETGHLIREYTTGSPEDDAIDEFVEETRTGYNYHVKVGLT
jgi:hypothetical protein